MSLGRVKSDKFVKSNHFRSNIGTDSDGDKILQHLLLSKYRKISKSVKNDFGHALLSRTQFIGDVQNTYCTAQ